MKLRETRREFEKRKFSGRDLLTIMDSNMIQVGVGFTKHVVREVERLHEKNPNIYRSLDYPPDEEDHMNAKTALTKALLENPLNREWSIQGLGMLRTYLDDDHRIRLHVWTTAHAEHVKASDLHTHPWDFHSDVVAGIVTNIRYLPLPEGEHGELIINAAQWQQQMIRCGEGGGLVGDPEIVWLAESAPERYGSSSRVLRPSGYEQRAEEIHRSSPEDGTVTIITRKFNSDTEHAHVYFPVGEEWISAEPRPATDEEILMICNNALEKWF